MRENKGYRYRLAVARRKEIEGRKWYRLYRVNGESYWRNTMFKPRISNVKTDNKAFRMVSKPLRYMPNRKALTVRIGHNFRNYNCVVDAILKRDV